MGDRMNTTEMRMLRHAIIYEWHVKNDVIRKQVGVKKYLHT